MWLFDKPESRRELIITRIVQAVVIIIVLVLMILLDQRPTSKSSSAPSARTQVVLVSDQTQPQHPAKDPDAWAATGAHKYRHHRLDNSIGRRVPKPVIRKLRDYVHHHSVSHRARRWWRDRVLNMGECLWNSTGTPLATPWQSLCLVYGETPTFTAITRRIQEIRVVCSGLAVFGALRGGGQWGAVVGGAGCAFTAGYTLYDHWAHQRRAMARHDRPLGVT